MEDDGHSLRKQIEKWFGPAQRVSIRISRAARSLTGGPRYAYVGVSHPSSPHVIFFFRHRDGSWRVYPPSAAQPVTTMSSRVA
jgi:hypothetical protein